MASPSEVPLRDPIRELLDSMGLRPVVRPGILSSLATEHLGAFSLSPRCTV